MKKIGLWVVLILSISGAIYAGFLLLFGKDEAKPVKGEVEAEDVEHEEVKDENSPHKGPLK